MNARLPVLPSTGTGLCTQFFFSRDGKALLGPSVEDFGDRFIKRRCSPDRVGQLNEDSLSNVGA